MQRLILTILLCLLASLATANGSFELRDPAAEIYEEQSEPVPESPPEPEAAPGLPTGDGMHCTVDMDNGECFCIGKASARRAPVGQQDCAALVRQALDRQAIHHSLDP